MIKKLILNKTLKDSLKNIKGWKKMDDAGFENKNYVSLTLDNPDIKKYFRIKGGTLELEFIVSRNFISYSPSTSTIYDLDENNLLLTAKNNNFRIIYFDKSTDFVNDVIYLSRKLIDQDYQIIPLDNKILIYSTEDIELEVDNKIYKAIEIEDYV